MKKKMAKRSLRIMAITFFIGIVLIFISSSVGQIMGDNAIQRNGGSIDTDRYERIINNNTFNYRTVGILLSSLGGFGVLLSGYALYKEL